MTTLQIISIPILSAALALGPAQLFAAAPEGDGEGEDEAPQDSQTRAMEAYQRGTELYAQAEFEAALEAFQEAATLYASPDFQFNIARCYERLGKFEEAVRAYEVYLRTAEDPPDRAVIESTIADLKQRSEEQKAAADKPEPEPEPDPQPDPEPVDTGPAKPGRALIITGGVLLGVGVGVGLGGGLAFGLQVSSDNATLGEVLDGNPDGLTFAQSEEIADRARTNQTLEIVMIGVGGAVAVTGVALLAVGLAKKNKAKSGASARLQVAPSWGPDGAGLTLRGSF